ncbi:MAG TPA: flagellar hook-associated protein FlgL [Steroidobacter sp.]|nr:flagellar hook-associated protein FlgL [Steroidobacter sp.]
MRLSTQGFFTASLAAMQSQAAELAKLLNQVGLGRRVNSPADDPIASVHIRELERAQSESEQIAKNSVLIRNRLNLEEQALADAGTILTRVRELTGKAANIGTLSDADRRSIATELDSRLSELLDLANRQDGAGEYLFAGFSTLTKPFTGGGDAPIVYAGDQGSRLIQIGPAQRLADSHSGFDVFVDIPEGNGVFATSANAANTGSGVIHPGSVVDRPSWVPDDYTVVFTAADAWEVRDSATPQNVVASGAYVSGAPIEFNGVRIEISGQPAVNDEFTVSRSRSKDIFTTVRDLAQALRDTAETPAGAARLATALEGAMQQVDQASEHLISVRSQVGARLSALDTADSARESRDVDIASALSELRDVDYAEALMKMNQRLVGLQAAQLSYSQISQLSLFSYLR